MGLGSNSEGVVRGGLTEEETLEAKKSKEARTPHLILQAQSVEVANVTSGQSGSCL